MKPVLRDPEMVARLERTFELYELAEQIQRQNIRRRNPGMSEEEVENRLVEWLRSRPDAPLGDAEGRQMDWPPKRQ